MLQKKLNYAGYEYDINDDTIVTVEIPDDWDSSTDIEVYVHWLVDQAYGDKNAEVRWQCDWAATPEGTAPDGGGEPADGPTHTGTISCVDQNIPAVAKAIVETEIGTISSASLAQHDILGLKISRIALTAGVNPDAAPDTTDKPIVLDIELEYIANKLGLAT